MAKTNETAKRDVAAEVTAKIVEALEAGTAPWVRPWTTTGAPSATLPRNAASGRLYRGINIILLWAAAFARGYSDPRWLTFNQAKALGGSVRKGERGTAIVFWKWIVKDEGLATEKRIPMARTFTLFNVAQCDGLSLEAIAAPAAPPAHVDGVADELAARAGAKVLRGGDVACYSPTLDEVRMPLASAFVDRGAYDATLLHELTHWTGHSKRLDRNFSASKRFGDDAYAVEELVAELGSAFLCARLGVEGKLQHAEYLGHWARVLRADKHAIFTAAREAEKAAGFLLPEPAEGEDEEAEAA